MFSQSDCMWCLKTCVNFSYTYTFLSFNNSFHLPFAHRLGLGSLWNSCSKDLKHIFRFTDINLKLWDLKLTFPLQILTLLSTCYLSSVNSSAKSTSPKPWSWSLKNEFHLIIKAILACFFYKSVQLQTSQIKHGIWYTLETTKWNQALTMDLVPSMHESFAVHLWILSLF